ncbi:MAG: hypothetical protein J0L88_14740 [Xanthomonadales bacterium]|nr:hypothetical protein [Xanthomonadales bacterium]
MPFRCLRGAAIALILAAGAAHSAEFCAATTNMIRQALATAGSNGEADIVRIVIGTYTPTTGSIAFPYSTSENHALTIEGGYTFGCGLRVDDADLTVLSGGGARPVMRIESNGSGAVTVRNLGIKDGESSGHGAGLDIDGPGLPFFVGFTGSINVERVAFLFNRTSDDAGGMYLATRDGSITVRGNLFAFNRCSGDNCALQIHSGAAEPINVRFGGNTVTLNTCNLGASACNSGGARFTGQQNLLLYDNLFALHGGGDISLQNPAVTAALYYNNYEVMIGSADDEVGSLNVSNPGFVDALGEDFRLQSTSPLRNQGNAPYALPSVDLDGHPRIIESAPDLGAYESLDILFADDFDG